MKDGFLFFLLCIEILKLGDYFVKSVGVLDFEVNCFEMNQNMAGDEDMQHHDNRESDAGEVNSVQVEREFKIEDELDKKHGSVKHDEATKKSYDGSSSGSSSNSCSSDDESQDIKNRQAASDIVSVESVKVADSLSGKSVEAIHNSPIAEAGDSVVETITVLGEQVEVDVHSPVARYVVESTLKENGEKKLGSVEDKTCTSVSFVDAALQGKEEAIVQCAENTATTSDPKECVTQENDDRLVSPYNAPRATGDNGTEHMKDSVVTQVLCCFFVPLIITSICLIIMSVF